METHIKDVMEHVYEGLHSGVFVYFMSQVVYFHFLQYAIFQLQEEEKK